MNKLLRITLIVFGLWGTVCSLSAQNLSDNSSSYFQEVRYDVHTVERGETLYSISRQYDMTVEMLKRLNKLNENHIEAGEQLRVILLTEEGEEPFSPEPSTETAPPVEVSTDTDYKMEPTSQDFQGYPRTMVASVDELLERQEGKLYREVHSLTFDEARLNLALVKTTLRPFIEDLNKNDFFVINITGIERFLQAEIFKYFADLPCKKLLILDLNFRYKHLQKQFQRWQREDDLIVVLSSTTEANVNSYWKYGAISQALSEGLEGAADMDRDRMVRLPELDYYLNERVKELTGQNQYAYIPIGQDIPLVTLEE